MNQLKVVNKPIIILNTKKYWDPLKKVLLNAYKEGFIVEKDFRYINWANDPIDLLHKIKNNLSVYLNSEMNYTIDRKLDR